MNAEQKQLRQLVDSIYEKTDMMLNAMVVDAFDIFEANLNIRQELLVELETLRKTMPEADVKALNLNAVWRQIQEMDTQVAAELSRFNDQIHQELSEVVKEKKQITQNRKKANQYQMISDSSLSGSFFDKKK